VLDLGDVEGPEKERRGDRVTRGRRDKEMRSLREKIYFIDVGLVKSPDLSP
jgi:hypothetical protein